MGNPVSVKEDRINARTSRATYIGHQVIPDHYNIATLHPVQGHRKLKNLFRWLLVPCLLRGNNVLKEAVKIS